MICFILSTVQRYEKSQYAVTHTGTFLYVNVCMSLLAFEALPRENSRSTVEARFYCAHLIVSFYSCNARKHLTFDGLEEGTTTGRDVRNLVGQTELVDTSYRVTTTDE